jgi:integrase/recombinase XerD|tara:strand:- start:173 stop:994 length:822 start_codon:yes stop_codon:yes gene_type:complete
MALEGKAKATIANYLRAPHSLMLHCNKLPEECTVDEIKAFLIHQRDSLNYSASTVNMRFCGLKHYFRNVSIRPDLVVAIPNPRIQKFQTKILTSEELNILYRSCKDMRQVIVISLMFECGLRSREVVRLRIGDFNKEHRSITIRNSKGNKTRVVPYSHSLRDDLKKYCKAIGAIPTGTLIESYKYKGAPLTTGGIQHIFKGVVKRSRLKERIHPHTIRHTFAVHYINNGGSIFRLQQILGHKYITTTLHYLKYAKIPEGLDISNLDIFRARGK